MCEPAVWEEEHHASGRERGASLTDVVRTLEWSRANDLALDVVDGPDPAVVSAVAARHLERRYVDAAMGGRPPEPRAARRWDRGVLLLERLRGALHIDDPAKPLGRKPSSFGDLIPWRRGSRELERARRSLERDDPGRHRGLER